MHEHEAGQREKEVDTETQIAERGHMRLPAHDVGIDRAVMQHDPERRDEAERVERDVAACRLRMHAGQGRPAWLRPGKWPAAAANKEQQSEPQRQGYPAWRATRVFGEYQRVALALARAVTELLLEFFDGAHVFHLHLEDNVPWPELGAARGRIFDHIGDDRARRLALDPELLFQVVGRIGHVEAEVAHFAEDRRRPHVAFVGNPELLRVFRDRHVHGAALAVVPNLQRYRPPDRLGD